MNTNKLAFAAAIAAMAVVLAFAVAPAFTSTALADPKGRTDVSCSNGNNLPPGQQPSCKNEQLIQNTCVSTTGNGKCPPGQN